VDEIRIWETNLELTELLDYYQIGVSSNEENLVIYYKFNEGAGVIIKDEVEEGLGPIDAILEGSLWL